MVIGLLYATYQSVWSLCYHEFEIFATAIYGSDSVGQNGWISRLTRSQTAETFRIQLTTINLPLPAAVTNA